jgi:hypothetical protein
MAAVEKRRDLAAGGRLREALLADLSVTERSLEVAGIATALLEGGEGTPVVQSGGGTTSRCDCGWPRPRAPATAGRST